MMLIPNDETVRYVSKEKGFIVTEKDGLQKLYPPGFNPQDASNVFARLLGSDFDNEYESWYAKVRKRKLAEAHSMEVKAHKDLEKAQRLARAFQKP